MTTIEVTGAAEEQRREIVEWWTVDRDTSPQLVMDEFERCIASMPLTSMPGCVMRSWRDGFLAGERSRYPASSS